MRACLEARMLPARDPDAPAWKLVEWNVAFELRRRGQPEDLPLLALKPRPLATPRTATRTRLCVSHESSGLIPRGERGVTPTAADQGRDGLGRGHGTELLLERCGLLICPYHRPPWMSATPRPYRRASAPPPFRSVTSRRDGLASGCATASDAASPLLEPAPRPSTRSPRRSPHPLTGGPRPLSGASGRSGRSSTYSGATATRPPDGLMMLLRYAGESRTGVSDGRPSMRMANKPSLFSGGPTSTQQSKPGRSPNGATRARCQVARRSCWSTSAKGAARVEFFQGGQGDVEPVVGGVLLRNTKHDCPLQLPDPRLRPL